MEDKNLEGNERLTLVGELKEMEVGEDIQLATSQEMD